MRSSLLIGQETGATREYQTGQLSGSYSNTTVNLSSPMTEYNFPRLQNQANNQTGGQGGGGVSGGSGSGGESQVESHDPITAALIPEPFSIVSVIIRTSIIALSVFVIVKWLGGKGIGQLSPFGLLIVVGLGTAIGDPMIYNEISIPQALVAVVIVVVFFKIIDYLTLKSKRFRESVEPNPILLVEYGKIDKAGLKKAKMDKEEFEIEMRLAGIENVDEIKFARLEPNGRISFIQRNKEKNKDKD